MQNTMAMTARALFDNVEIPGLIKISAFKSEYKSVTIPKQNAEFQIDSIPVVIPVMTLEYLVERNTNTEKFFRDFHTLKQEKDCTIVYSDGHGSSYEDLLLIKCACSSIEYPEYSTESPGAFKIVVVLKPQDYKFIQ